MKKLLTLLAASGALIGTTTVLTACNDNTALSQATQTLQDELNQANDQLKNSQAELSEKVKELETLHQTLEKADTDKTFLADKILTVKKELEIKQNQISIYKNKVSLLQLEIDALKTGNKELRREIASLENENTMLNNEIFKLEKELVDLKEDIKNANTKISDLESRLLAANANNTTETWSYISNVLNNGHILRVPYLKDEIYPGTSIEAWYGGLEGKIFVRATYDRMIVAVSDKFYNEQQRAALGFSYGFHHNDWDWNERADFLNSFWYQV